jgi:2,4-dienoyl-CoA reductase-like NADH-dependent reductase (Old Yellow Enzyme family)/thioredoxin reductase
LGNEEKMDTRLTHIFQPLKLDRIELKNRLELAPACFMLATHDGYATREMVAYFKNIAKGGAAVITMGETPIDRESAPAHEYSFNVGNDKAIHGLSDVVEAVHRYGAKLSIELNHSGPIKLMGALPIGPSNIPTKLEEELAAAQGRAVRPVQVMSTDMIDDIIGRFADAAERCYKAGMEMIMIHAGHGHLIGSFLSPLSNHRTDDYGGSLENRARFAVRVIDEIRNRVGDKLAIEMRMSANELVDGGLTEDETIPFARMFEGKIDLLHVSAGVLGNNLIVPEMIQPTYWPHCYHVHRAARFKREVNIPITAIGSISDIETANGIIADGKADVVAMARGILCDPEMANKARRGNVTDIRPCMRCFTCNKRTRYFNSIRCAVNPVLGRELDYAELRPARVKKKVVVVGGGPAGMEAARTAALRGHEVTLFETAAELGGNMRRAAALGIKADLKRYYEYAVRQTLKSPGIDIRLGTEATRDAVADEKPDALIVCVGANPIMPKIPGSENSRVIWVGDADGLIGSGAIKGRVLIAGAGATGAETALQLATDGVDVSLIDGLDFEKEIVGTYPRGLALKLIEYGVPVFDKTMLEEVEEGGAWVRAAGGEREFMEADTILLSFGFRPRSAESHLYDGIAPEIYYAGDCVKVGDIFTAVHGGFDTAVEI